MNVTHEVVIGAAVGEVVGENPSTDAFLSIRVDEMIVDAQRLEYHGGV